MPQRCRYFQYTLCARASCSFFSWANRVYVCSANIHGNADAFLSLFATSIITQVWSTSLLLFCTFVLFVCLLRGWTTSLLPQVANIFEVLVLLVWIALLEGVFTSIVGLKYVHERRYLMHTVLFLFQA